MWPSSWNLPSCCGKGVSLLVTMAIPVSRAAERGDTRLDTGCVREDEGNRGGAAIKKKVTRSNLKVKPPAISWISSRNDDLWFVLICLIVYQILEVIELTSVDLRFRPWWRFYSFSVRWQSLGMAQCFRRFSTPHVLGQSWSTILLRTYEKIKFLSTTHSLATF